MAALNYWSEADAVEFSTSVSTRRLRHTFTPPNANRPWIVFFAAETRNNNTAGSVGLRIDVGPLSTGQVTHWQTTQQTRETNGAGDLKGDKRGESGFIVVDGQASPVATTVDVYLTRTSSGIAYITDVRMIAFELPEGTAVSALNTTRVTNSSSSVPTTIGSVTPAAGEYVVLAAAVFDQSSTSNMIRPNITDGSASKFAAPPYLRIKATSDRIGFRIAWDRTGAAALTGAETLALNFMSNANGAAAGAQYARLVAIPTAAFRNVYIFEDNTADSASATTSYADTATSFTPTIAAAGPHVTVMSATVEGNDTSTTAFVNFLADGSELGETFWESESSTVDRCHKFFGTADLETLAAGARTYKFQRKRSSGTSAIQIEKASLVIFDLESAAGGSGAELVVPALAAEGAAQAPAIRTGAAVASPGGAAGAAAYALAIATGTRVDVPAPAAAAQAFGPGVAGGAAAAVPTVQAEAAAHAPQVAASARVEVPALSAQASGFAPAVGGGACVQVPALTGAASASAPAIGAGAAVTVPALSAAGEVQAPQVSASARVEVPAAAAQASVHPPAVAGGAGVQVPALSASAGSQAPHVGVGAVAAVPALAAQSAAFAPQLASGAGVQVPAATASATALAPEIGQGTVVSVPTVTAAAQAQTPAIRTGARVQPPAAQAQAQAFAPGVGKGAVIEVPALDAAAAAAAPGVAAGAAAPAPVALAAAQAFGPQIRTGAAVAVPTAQAEAQAVPPGVGAAAVVEVPGLVAGALAVPPTLAAGGSVAVPAAAAQAAALGPNVIIWRGLVRVPALAAVAEAFAPEAGAGVNPLAAATLAGRLADQVQLSGALAPTAGLAGVHAPAGRLGAVLASNVALAGRLERKAS